MSLKKLNARGFSHDIAIVAFVVIFAIAGVAYLVVTKADPLSPSIAQITASETVDVAAPQCGNLASIGHHVHGIIGVNGTNGNFSKNPCLGGELSHFGYYTLYALGNWPSPDCGKKGIKDPYNCGKAAADFAYGHAAAQHAYASTWWIDVETGNHLWNNPGSTPSHSQDQAFLYGMAHELKSVHDVTTVGYYSTRDLWSYITGGWKPDAPTWYASGIGPVSNTPANLQKDYCHMTFGRPAANTNTWVQFVRKNPGYPNYPMDVDVHC